LLPAKRERFLNFNLRRKRFFTGKPSTLKIHFFPHAIKKVIKKGYKPSIAIDPIIKIPNYKKVYKEMIEKIFTKINPKDIESIIFGTFRMNSTQFKTIKKSLVSDLMYYPYKIENKKVFYEDEKEIIEYFKEILSKYKENIFYV
jgi:DNA repair photolyase